MRWFHNMLATRDDWALTVARVFAGGMMFAHGAQKMLGWWGGGGYADTMEKMSAGLPPFIAFLVIMIEFFGSLFLVFGLLSRPAALSLVIVMIGAMVKVHLPNGFFASDKGIEINLLYLGLALAPLIGGGGALSLDRLILKARSAGAGAVA
jgi:putative oxidoreductase